MKFEIKVALAFVGLTIWVVLVSVGVYRWNHHSALDQAQLVYECSSELVKKHGADVSGHSWIFIAKYGSKSYVKLETPLTVPYTSGDSFTCSMDSRGLVQEVWKDSSS
jgi:hypothetical protein